MRIVYEIEDGYVGGKRPHAINVDDQDLEDCETEGEKVRLIDELVEEDFKQNIYPYWDHSQLKKQHFDT